jgi:ABC-type sugar transport system ATPase subunit
MIRIKDLRNFCLDGVSLEIPSGQYGVLMGKTGSGKTTLLECLCGLRPIDGGSIYLAGEEVTTCRVAKRNIGYVPQDGALFPTMKVRENLSLSLEVRNWASPKIAERVNKLAELLSISHLLDRRPVNLSGGEAQRVALGRALAFGPAILLLDEPLSALDDSTRDQMYELLKDVQHATQVTTLHVTHSTHEARRLADCTFVLENGRIAHANGSSESRPGHFGSAITN